MKQFSEATRAQKEHYDLRSVKARTKRTEILYIFFGIHTANMVQFGEQDRTKGAFGGCLTETCGQCGVLVGELYPRHERRTKKSGRNDRKQI